ncbi:penicillin acylase family protein [Mucilaginibacter angelicae]|uniref:Penicillin acylase family protein n=1 Tax=Mucilaginibacter angelicae TaxID=869718 RepID=A0ABV6LA87_9SPHI
MKEKLNFNFYFLFPMTALIILIFALSNQLFGVAPLGRILNPFIGVVQYKSDQMYLQSSLKVHDRMLHDSVSVFFDNRKVPHIYAKNDHDMYFAQGYVTAYLRLWQMDFLTYVGAGRMSEIFDKPEFLDYDRNQRRLGILASAQQSLKVIEKDVETNNALTAYTNGVNAYINRLNYKDLPFEYKILDYKPELWSKLKSVIILKQLGNTLSGYEEDAYLSKMILALGDTGFNKLFPDFVNEISPIVPDNAKLKDSVYKISKPSYLDFNFLYSNSVLSKSSYNPKLGSNSWAVSGKKTKSGFPILCTDPHLNLTLPAVWLEMQLSAPGTNVYGVCIPGTPAITIGFNEKIAWGMTNGADDVKDWYKLKISNDYRRYKFDGKWLNLGLRVEEIRRRNQKSFFDTVFSTIHGPIIDNKSFPKSTEYMNYALSWQLHRPSNEFITFIKLNKAQNYVDFQNAVRSYCSPTQNFTFASTNNDIAIFHQGNMAVKSKGQGKFIMDGTKSEYLFTKNISPDSLPRVHNPQSGYVFSANQHPTTQAYPHYYNGYYTEARANRINALLKSGDKFDVERMKAIQLDNVSDIAVKALPLLNRLINKGKLNAWEVKQLASISGWNGAYNKTDQKALFFDLWWKKVSEYTFDEFNSYYFNIRFPDDYVLLDLIEKDPADRIFDKLETAKVENASDIITQSFINANKEYEKQKLKGSIAWGDINKVNVLHMTKLEALSINNLSSAGNPNAINAVSSGWGPSWRMVVELGDHPKAFGIYPGGQSGNPASSYYSNFVQPWNNGQYFPLNFYRSISEARKVSTNKWVFANN